MSYEPRTAAHNFVSEPATLHDVVTHARQRQRATGRAEWIHHHPHGNLCDHRCGPLDAEAAPA